MCTVSVVPHADGFRLICNRDERRSRPAARPPQVHLLDGVPALCPIDPAGGGTWVGVNVTGLTAVLLNRTRDGTAESGALSRGLIVPRLLGEESLGGAVRALEALPRRRFRPFRLLVLHRSGVALATSDGRELSTVRFFITSPLMLTSSSLGDAIVRGARRRLFERLVLAAPQERRLEAQARFHEHQWPAHPAFSVRMQRPDARTVSRTTVNVDGGCVSLLYSPTADIDTFEETAA